jgi:hypothetical protein
MKALALACAALLAAPGAHARDLGGWTQPYASNPLCTLKITRVFQTSSGQPIHVVLTNMTRDRLRFDLAVILDNGRTGETRQINDASVKPGEVNADFATNTGYSTTGRAVKLRIDDCRLN